MCLQDGFGCEGVLYTISLQKSISLRLKTLRVMGLIVADRSPYVRMLHGNRQSCGVDSVKKSLYC